MKERTSIPQADEGSVPHAVPTDIACTIGILQRFSRARATVLTRHAGLFGDPAWELLLAIFISDQRQESISVKSAIHACGAPASTALRYIANLEKIGLVKRLPHPFDRRSKLLRITGPGQALVEDVARPLYSIIARAAKDGFVG